MSFAYACRQLALVRAMTSAKLPQPPRSVLIGRKLYSGPTTPAKRGSLRPAVKIGTARSDSPVSWLASRL